MKPTVVAIVLMASLGSAGPAGAQGGIIDADGTIARDVDEPAMARAGPHGVATIRLWEMQDSASRHRYMLSFDDYRAGRRLKTGGIVAVSLGCTCGIVSGLFAYWINGLEGLSEGDHSSSWIIGGTAIFSAVAGVVSGIPMIVVGVYKMRRARRRMGLADPALPTPSETVGQGGTTVSLIWRF
jgi:hypothetical protein